MREFEIFYCLNFKLTLREYKARFDNATKRADETFIYFAARLRNNLRYYLRRRDCLDDLGKLFKRRRASIPVRRWCAIVASKRGM